MADPLTDAYEREIQRRTAPLTKGQQISQGIADLLPPAGISPFQYYPMLAAEKMASGVTDYLESPSDLVEGVRSGAIKENDPRLAGVDLVDIFDDDPTLGVPDFVPDDYEAGEIFTFDPTGEGKSKSVSDAMDLQAEIDKLGTVGGRGEIVEGPTERADFLEKQRGLAAEEFRLKEKQLVDSQGGLNSMSVADSTAAKQDAAEQLFAASMEDFISGVRGKGPETNEVRTLKDYKDEFFRATGIKAPGKINAGAALMAAGTAMMNNQMGGKGFSGMMSVLGQASEAAMPELVKAREKVDLESRAAGKYALEMRNADQATARAAKEKAMERSDYFIVPKTNNVVDFLANSVGEGKGRLESLSKYELNALRNDPKFREQFDVLPGSMWGTIVSEAMKTPEAKDKWLTKGRSVNLLKGNDDNLFQIEVFDANPNTNPGGGTIAANDGQRQYEALARMARDVEKTKQKFVDLGALNKGTNIFRYSLDSLNGLSSAFGVKFGEDVPPTQQMKMILGKLEAQEAPSILGEAGKTISDADRLRVTKIIGEITPTTDARELGVKFQNLFNDIVLGAENDIRGALSTLNRYTNRSIGASLGEGELSEDEQKELKIGLESIGAL
jgi:hypothetical protein